MSIGSGGERLDAGCSSVDLSDGGCGDEGCEGGTDLICGESKSPNPNCSSEASLVDGAMVVLVLIVND